MVVRGGMKFFSRFLVGLLIFMVLVFVLGFLILRGVNPNIFRTELEQYLAKQTGVQVELGDVDLHWGGQIEVEINGIKIYNPKSLEKLLESRNVRITAELLPLFYKQFTLSRILIQNPQVFLKRRTDNTWNWMVGTEESAPPLKDLSTRDLKSPEAISSPIRPSRPNRTDMINGAAWAFTLKKVEIQEGVVQFVDETVQPAYQLRVEQCRGEMLKRASDASFHTIFNGSILGDAPKNIQIEGDLDLASKIMDFNLRFSPEKIALRGMMRFADAKPHFEGQLEMIDLDLETNTPQAYKTNEYLVGRLTLQTQIAFDGVDRETIKRSLKGQGKIEIRDGALKNRNVIKEVFDRLTPVLAVTTALGAELPPEIGEMLAGKDTPFQQADIAFQVYQGLMRIDDLNLIHRHYQLSGKGTYGFFENGVDFALRLALSQSISEFMIKKVHELEYLTERNGQVIIPFRYNGLLPRASIQPDLQYVGSKILAAGANKLLDRGIQKLSKILEPKHG